MIKANDFRVGNYIMYNECTTWLKVEYIAKTAIGAIDINNISFYHFKENEIKPIPLTPEILEKVGFGKSCRSNWSTNEPDTFKVNLHDLNNSKGYLNLILDISNGPSPQIKYLHQLQNLIHTLTGEELQINLKEFVTIK